MDKYSFEELVEKSLMDDDSKVGIETFFEVMNASDFRNKFDVGKFSNQLRTSMSRLDENNPKVKRTGQKKKVIVKTDENRYSFFHSFESFFYSWLDIEAPKELYSVILDINREVEEGKEIIIDIYTAWTEFIWEYILFISVHGSWFNELIFSKLKAKKIVYIDTWCNVGSLLAASYADEIIVGEFSDVILTMSSTMNLPANMQKVLDENKKNILLRLVSKGLLLENEMNSLLVNPINSIFLNSIVLKERAAIYNKK